MAARTFSVVTAVGLVAALSAHADSGDIVDQVLQKRPPQPASSNTASLAIPSSASASATLDSSDTVAQAPVQLTPQPAGPAAVNPAAASPAPAAVSGDIVNQVLSTLPPPPAGPPPASQPGPMPVSASVAPGSSGDVIDQGLQAMPAARPEGFLPWTGFNLGVNLGAGTTRGGTGVTCINSVTNDVTGCDNINNGGFNTSGVIGGGQVGYMTPFTAISGLPLLIGAEVDIQGTGIGGSQTVSGPFPIAGFPAVCSQCSYTASQQLDWFGTLRARIGVPVDRFLIYGTGGLMVGGVTASQSLSFASSPGYIVSAKSTLSGPTAGGGVELLLPGPWSARIEALYYDLGTLQTVTTPQPGFAANFREQKSFGFQGAIIRLGINLRLGDLGGS